MVLKSLSSKILDMVFKRCRKGLPEQTFKIGNKKVEFVEMSDGTKLATHIIFPAKVTKAPILLMRSPYSDDTEIMLFILAEFVKYGFTVCYQECRGRGASEGKFEPFMHERQDSLDTYAWLKAQKWYSGKVALVGASYFCYTALCWCDKWDEDIVTAFCAVFGDNIYDAFYMNGMFKDDFGTCWAIQNNSIQNHATDNSFEIFAAFQDAKPRGGVLRQALGGDVPFYNEMLASRSSSDRLWTCDGIPDVSAIKSPICLLTGYFDFSVPGAKRLYDKLENSVREKSRFVVGPWTHVFMNKGTKKAPNSDIPGAVVLKLAFEWLLNKFFGYEIGDKLVKRYIYNRNEFVESKSFPDVYSQTAFLHHNHLTLHEPKQISSKRFVYVPSEPVKTVGGNALAPAMFSRLRRLKQCIAHQDYLKRGDVLVFSGDRLHGGKTVLGAKVKLVVASDCADTCFSVKLCVKEGRNIWNLCSGVTTLVNNGKNYTPYEPNSIRELKIELNPIGYQLKNKSRLVFVITSSDYPSYAIHPNVDESLNTATDYRSANQTVYIGNGGTEVEIFYEK